MAGRGLPAGDTNIALAHKRDLQPGNIARNQCAAVVKSLSAGLRGEGGVGQAQRDRCLRQEVEPFVLEVLQRGWSPRRQRQDLPAVATPYAAVSSRRCLFDNHVRVGAADAERVDRRAPRLRPFGPGLDSVHDIKRSLGDIETAVRLTEIQAGWNQAVAQSQRHLDQRGNASCGVEVTNIGFERTDTQRSRSGCTVSLRQCGNLDRVADRCASAVRLDVRDRRGFNARDRQCLNSSAGLSIDTGSKVAGFLITVIVDGRAAYHGVNIVAVANCVGQTPQHDDPGAAAEHRSVRVLVEGAAMTVR